MKNNILFKSLRLLKSVNNNVYFTILFSNIIKAANPFVNVFLLYKITELLIAKADLNIIVLHIIVFVFSSAVLAILDKCLAQYLWSNINNKIYLHERASVINKLMNVDFKFLETNEFVDNVNKYSDDLNNSGSGFISLLFMLSSAISGCISTIVSIIMLIPFIKTVFFASAELSKLQIFLIVLTSLGVIIALISGLIINKSAFNLQLNFLNKNKLFGYYSKLCSDHKSGKDIRVYQCENMILNHATQELLLEGTKINNKIGTYKGINVAISTFIGSLIYCAIYLILGINVLEGVVSIALLVKYTGAFLQFIEGVKSLIASIGVMAYIVPKLKLYYNVIEYAADMDKTGINIPDKINTIEFKNVSYSYSDNTLKAIDNVSITLNKGQTIAFVGENGSGKSTFVKLLCGLYDGYKGTITVNDCDIKKYNKEQYYDIFSVTSQDFSVFSLPVCENIAFSKEYDINRIKMCLNEVDMLTRVENMKNKYNTYLYHDCSEQGVEISGGEAQKLALARCLYKDSEFIILDEPTSALDPISESNIYKKMNNYIKSNNKTAILISHRLSSCFFCDKIAVFDKGKIIEFGSHDDLIKNKDSKYYKLWHSQAKYYE